MLRFDALRGNVETELCAENDTGCGCAYPDWVDDTVVARSNRIAARLRDTARNRPHALAQLAALPMQLRVDVGDCRVAVVHGDAESLAGWGFAQEHLRDAAQRRRVRGWFDAAQVDVFACSHTCLPLLHAQRAGVVMNNGAAGMPNFAGEHAGLLTRIATTPFSGAQRRHGHVRQRVHLDAIDIDYDVAGWHARFLRAWPPGSDALASYWQRIANGPAYRRADARLITED